VVAQTPGGVERGWITLPGGQYTRESDPRANASETSYDWGLGAWVTAGAEALSPDGASYVIQNLTSSGPTFYLVDARTGKQRLILSTHGPSVGIDWSILTWQSAGIYLVGLGVTGETPSSVPGLWLLDPLTGHVRLIDRSHAWDLIGGGVAWAQDAPTGGVGTWTVYRLDVTSGVVNKAYASDDFSGLVAPTPDGDVLVRGGDNGGAERIFLLTRAGQLTPVAWPSDFGGDYGGVLDQPGVWMPIATGIALYTKAFGVQVMAQSPYGAMLFPAGACR
jgi:hypothetical protein